MTEILSDVQVLALYAELTELSGQIVKLNKQKAAVNKRIKEIRRALRESGDAKVRMLREMGDDLGALPGS